MNKHANHKRTYTKGNYDGKPHPEKYIQHALGCPTKKWNRATSTQQLPRLDRHLDVTGLLGCNGSVGSGCAVSPD
jgi:hypothetical protein